MQHEIQCIQANILFDYVHCCVAPGPLSSLGGNQSGWQHQRSSHTCVTETENVSFIIHYDFEESKQSSWLKPCFSSFILPSPCLPFVAGRIKSLSEPSHDFQTSRFINMNGRRLNANLVYRNGQQPPRRPHCSRQQMPPPPNYPRYEDFEYRYDSTRPTPRSRRSMDVPRSDPRYGPAALIDEMYNRRLPNSSPTRHDQPIAPHPHPHPYPHQAYQRPPEPHRLSFDNAAHHLFKDLTTSRSFFGDLLDSFDREVSGIRLYADAKIQETLWRRKIEKLDEEGAKQQESLRHHHHLPANLSRNPNLPPPAPSGHPIPTFYSTASRLIDALKTAANSVPVRTAVQPQPNFPPPPPGFSVNAPPPPPPPLSQRTDEEIGEETESMKRLIKKLQGQYRDLCDLIEGSKKSARKCSDLVKDLGILLDVLNISGNLWRQDGVEGQ